MKHIATLLLSLVIASCGNATYAEGSNNVGIVVAVMVVIVGIVAVAAMGGKKSDDKPTVDNSGKVDKLIPLLKEFELEAQKRIKPVDISKVTIKVGKLLDPKVTAVTEGSGVIIFNEINFDKHSTDHLRYVMFHEMGHAVLNKSHSTNPTSIMANGDVTSSGTLKLNEVARIDELFNNQ